MAFNLFRWVCVGEDQHMLQKKIKWYILGTLVFSLGLAFLALGCTYSFSHPLISHCCFFLTKYSFLNNACFLFNICQSASTATRGSGAGL